LHLFFFFQAEDGIRDFHVTGVQTCALPILVAGMGVFASRRAASSNAVVPDVSSSAPGPTATESKWLEMTYTRSGSTVPRKVANTLAVRPPSAFARSNHCCWGS